MADEPTPAGGEGAAVAAKPETTPSAEGKETKPQESADERVARLEKEVEAHRKTQAEWQPKIEELNRLKATGVSTPPTSAPAQQADALTERIHRLQAQAQQYPEDPTVQEALETATFKWHARERQRVINQAQGEFDAMPENVREKARQLWMGGQAANPQAARSLAEREVSLEAERTKLAKEREELEKDRKARAEGRQSLGGRPVLGPDKPSGDGLQRVTQSRWDHLSDLPEEEQRVWLRRYNEGKVEVVPG